MIFDRLAIGTANFGREYNGVKVSEKEQVKILDYCKKVGINMIDTAERYEWDYSDLIDDFEIVTKFKQNDILRYPVYAALQHEPGAVPIISASLKKKEEDGYIAIRKRGVSVYNESEIPLDIKPDVIQCPYSLYDRRFEKIFHALKLSDIEIHVRSVFLRGRILEKALPHDCISFCLMNPYVDRVIIGVDSLEQLKQNLETFVMFDSLKTDDENIIDPRKWKDIK